MRRSRGDPPQAWALHGCSALVNLPVRHTRGNRRRARHTSSGPVKTDSANVINAKDRYEVNRLGGGGFWHRVQRYPAEPSKVLAHVDCQSRENRAGMNLICNSFARHCGRIFGIPNQSVKNCDRAPSARIDETGPRGRQGSHNRVPSGRHDVHDFRPSQDCSLRRSSISLAALRQRCDDSSRDCQRAHKSSNGAWNRAALERDRRASPLNH